MGLRWKRKGGTSYTNTDGRAFRVDSISPVLGSYCSIKKRYLAYEVVSPDELGSINVGYYAKRSHAKRASKRVLEAELLADMHELHVKMCNEEGMESLC